MKKLIGFAAIFIGFMVTFLSALAFFLEDYAYSFHGTPIWLIVLGMCVMFLGLIAFRTDTKPEPPGRKSARTEVDNIAMNENRLSTNQVATSVFNLAVRLEHAMAGFYLQASKQASDHEAAKAFRNLALKELEHEEHFSELKLKYSASTDSPVEEGTKRFITKYIGAVRDLGIFDFDYYLSEVLSGKEKTRDVVQLAIGFEKESIVFYSGLQNFIEDAYLKGVLGAILRDEFKHLSELTDIDFV